ncbi:uncharacterized protein PV06_01576 [Exophiala oligosperma]|uniref:Uncharacterized protein n=1 Tax=Exophiala oligosperma TaxID=215243 RepID=A0A0D2DTK8_9EURO|nr:uncharacterized protein PV06_01576 [Exophiala oligosperma]KIW45865.1 hypothetical protein PV06_01576 [Exophiala oligosperma]
MTRPKTFFLMPNFDTPYPGPIKLGSLIFDPYSTTKQCFNFANTKGATGKVGIFARFMVHVVTMGANFLRVFSVAKVSDLKFEGLETIKFVPSQQYILDSGLDEPVRKQLERKWFKKNVYMITGVKVARGPWVKLIGKEATMSKVGLAALMKQAGVRVEGEIAVKVTDGVSWIGGSDFVFAIQLREIFFKSRSQTVNSKIVHGGEVMAMRPVGERKPDEDEKETPKETLSEVDELVPGSIKMGRNEVDANCFDLKTDLAKDEDDEDDEGDGDDCVCVYGVNRDSDN